MLPIKTSADPWRGILTATMANYMIADLPAIEPTRCPCGWARRAFATPDNTTATMHLVEITQDSRPHYHKKMTEIYLILEGEGFMELDGEQIPVRPMTSIFIKPGCRHRAVGKLRIINIPVPAFDPADEWTDDGHNPGGGLNRAASFSS